MFVVIVTANTTRVELSLIMIVFATLT